MRRMASCSSPCRRQTPKSRTASCGTRSAPVDATTSRAWCGAELARDKLKGKKIAVIHDKTTYGKGLADAALDNMHKFGIKEVLYEGVNTGEKDYSAIVSKVKESGAEYLMWGGLQTEGGLIIRQMR